MNRQKEKLVRKENKQSLMSTYNVDTGQEYRWNRQRMKDIECETMFQPMKSKKLGRSFVPLFRFLIASVGKEWNLVYSECKRRLDHETKPIFWIVQQQDSCPIVRIGESTYCHTLYVDENGILQYVDKNATFAHFSDCDTYTLDGKVNNRTTETGFEIIKSDCTKIK